MSHSNPTAQSDYKQNLIDKLVRRPGLRGKVDAMCIECLYDPYQDGNWRIQVAKCTSMACPMHSVRPTSSSNSEGE